MSRLYALLVGINDYPEPIPRLRGCVNDVEAMAAYLEQWAEQTDTELHLYLLKDQQATRAEVIRVFQEQLTQAGQGDTVLFAYSGHGSQETTSEEFWSFEPDRLNETLVCWDSRSEGSRDLADKELSKLIADVAQNNPQITVILDCCHSGSGSRVLDTRYIEPDRRPRSHNSYLFSAEEMAALASSSSPTRSLNSTRSTTAFPYQGRHVLLAACQDFEKAKEHRGKQRGLFSYFLLETLQQASSPLTYREIFKRTEALLRGMVPDQTPQLEATYPEDLERAFLGQTLAKPKPYFTVSYDANHGWMMDAGAIHGIPVPTGTETTHLALLPFDCDRTFQSVTPVGKAQVTEVLPQLSYLRVEGIDVTQTEQVFKAVITQLPLKPIGVAFEGDETGLTLLRTALAAIEAGQPSLYVQEAITSTADLRVLAEANQYRITDVTGSRSLVRDLTGFNPHVAEQVVQRLEHIARWMTVAELGSSVTSQIPADAVQLQIYEDNQEIQTSPVTLSYTYQNGRWQQPRFRLKLTNTSQQTLYCAVLDLNEQYGIDAPFFEAGSVRLQPGEEAWALGGKDLYASVPKELAQQGVTEVRDIFKLIVSTASFDPRLLEQPNLDAPSQQVTRSFSIPTRQLSSLNRLMQRVQTRVISAEPEDATYDDWVSSQLVIKVVRPQDERPVPQAGMPLHLGAGVVLNPHPVLQANAQLTSLPQVTRSLQQPTLPLIFSQNSNDNELVYFTRSRGSDPGLSILELNQVVPETVQAVTPEAPLRLSLEIPLAEGELILPIAYDGEFFIPLGRSQRTASGTDVVLERLPAPTGQGERSLGGSIRIFFQKILSHKLGLEFTYPQLSAIYLRPNGDVVYEDERTVIRAQIAEAKRVLLLVHGLFGDTPSLVTDLQTNPSTVQFLRSQYDMILGFDYESFNTSVEETARQLKQCLQAIGLAPKHRKTLDIVGYELGGLMGRWLVEREAGNELVNHLVLVGTPNAGTPWSTVQAWATAALGIGLNSLSTVAWPVKVIGSLVAAIEMFDVTLDQMQPGSELLKSLEASPDPKIPYTLIAGDRSVQPKAVSESEQGDSLLSRLLNKLVGNASNLMFLGQPNDLFASLYSLKGLSSKELSSLHVQEIACDHFTYFNTPAGLDALTQALRQS